MRSEQAEAFLGVENSLLGKRWVPRLDKAGEARAEAIAQAHGFEDVLARVLAGRGATGETAAAWLDPKLRDLTPDPSTLVEMDRAVARLVDAIMRGEQIAIFGDYDVDGACSSALLAEFLTAAGAPPPFVHIPDRILEGYGPNIDAIRELRARGAQLLVTVDCGTTSHEALAEAAALGLDAVVFDHHQAPEELPAAACVVNPNRQDDLSGQGALCAAGVVFLALVALNRELRRRDHWSTARPAPELLAGLDLVALATVADVAALNGLNRAFVLQGLAVMQGRRRTGLAALMEAARLDGPLNPYHLGFVLGPRINAGGRIGDASLGSRLLTMTDPAEAASIALTLDRLNAERQALEKTLLETATAEAEEALRRSNRLSCLVVGGDDWHPGIVGLIASRLKERFNIPSFAFGFKGENGTGSGRGLSGANLGLAVRSAVEAGVAIKGGGHAMAAGATIARAKLDAFRTFMNDAIEAQLAGAPIADILSIDASLTARGARLELLQRVEMAGPYGQGNADPVYVLPGHSVAGASVVGADRSHVRARLRSGDGAQLEAICFRALSSPLGEALLNGRGETFHIAARLSVGAFRGREKVDAQIIDLAHARA
jgi:single-stranded-DNA-specific exonuclease